MAIELFDLVVFLSVYRSESVSRSAHELRISKSVVSKRIAGLEANLNSQLFHRLPRGVRPTSKGMSFAVDVGEILERLDAAKSRLGESDGTLRGPLRLTVPACMRSILAPALMAFGREHPELTLKVHATDELVEFDADGYDAAIRVTRFDNEPFVARPLATARRILVASPGYLRGAPPVGSLDALSNHQSVECTVSPVERAWRFCSGDKTQTCRPRVTGFASNEVLMAKDAVLADLGVAILPAFLVADDIASKRLIHLLPSASPESHSVRLVYRPHRFRSPKVEVLYEFLRPFFSSHRAFADHVTREAV